MTIVGSHPLHWLETVKLITRIRLFDPGNALSGFAATVFPVFSPTYSCPEFLFLLARFLFHCVSSLLFLICSSSPGPSGRSSTAGTEVEVLGEAIGA